MIYNRESSSACVFEEPLQIYIFGGQNIENERLDSIEQYDIVEDKWTLIDIKLSLPMSNMVCHAIGREKVLILGTGINELAPDDNNVIK